MPRYYKILNLSNIFKQLGVIIIFLIMGSMSFAQKDLREGYIIKNNGDTISGKISFQGDIKNSKVCVFYPEGDDRINFQPFDISAYRFKDGKFYISKYVVRPDSILKVFAECLVSGKKDLYYYRNYDRFHYLINLTDTSIVEVPYSQKIVNKEGTSYLYTSTSHRGYLKTYFSDCPAIYDDIDRLNSLSSKDLISITKEYHDITCGENSCIVYKKKKYPVKIAIEPRFEMIHFKDVTGYYDEYGALVYVWLPNANERLFLKSGFFWSEYSDEIVIEKIPFQIEYLFHDALIRPKFDVGVNIYWARGYGNTLAAGVTAAASGGFLVRATHWLYFDVSFESDLVGLSLESENKELSFENGFLPSHTFGFGTFILF